MERLHQLEERIAPTLESMGFEVVRIGLTRASGDGHRTLQVMADRLDGSLISIDDCEVISQALSAIFDVEDPVPGAYDLEVSSAGIDRPLTRPKDFETYAGFEARIEMKVAVDGRKRFKGKVNGLAGDGQVLMKIGDTDVSLVFANIGEAKLVLTNDLIAATAKGRPQAKERKKN